MASPYAERLARVRAEVDARFSDRIVVTPMASPQRHGLTAPGAAGAPFEIVGKLVLGHSTEQNLTGSNTNQWFAQMPHHQAALHVDPDAHPRAKAIASGWRMAVPDRGLEFIVSRVDHGSFTRLIFNLSEVAP